MADEFDAFDEIARHAIHEWRSQPNVPVFLYQHVASAFRAAWQAKRCETCQHWKQEKWGHGRDEGYCNEPSESSPRATYDDSGVITKATFSCALYTARPASGQEPTRS